MTRSLTGLLVGALAATGAAAAFESWPDRPDGPILEAIVDLTRIENGRIPVRISIRTNRPWGYTFDVIAKHEEYRFRDVRFLDGNGKPIPHTLLGSRYSLAPFEGREIRVEYDVIPGGNGRHGMQGAVQPTFALFDGRLFLMPRDEGALAGARVRYLRPEGWSVGSPFRESDDWYYVDGITPDRVGETLLMSCVGVGRLAHARKTFGNTEFRVATVAEWSGAERDALEERSFRLFAYFHERFGLRLGSPYSVVWIPRIGPRKVYGGAHSNGTCFSHRADELRGWQLLAHRLGHSVNKYPPSGMKIAEPEDFWIREGWPSYLEVQATADTGLADDEGYFNTLYARYLAVAERFPERNMALADDPKARGNALEFMHYTKAPVAVKMLEFLLTDRTDVTLDAFMATMWRRHGWLRSPMRFRDELEEMAGRNFDDFWSLVVHANGPLIPAWPEYVTAEVRERMKRPHAATVGGEAISGDYLHFLAWSGAFSSYREIREFVVNEHARRKTLTVKGARLYPDVIREHLYALPARGRYAIATLEAGHPLVTDADAVRARAGDRPLFEPNPDDPDGRAFAELLATEQPYLDALGAAGLSSVRVRAGVSAMNAVRGKERLAFHAGSTIVVEADWQAPPAEAALDTPVPGLITPRWPARIADGAHRVVWTLEPDDRSPDDGVVHVRLSVPDREPVIRTYWQRGPGPRRPGGGRR